AGGRCGRLRSADLGRRDARAHARGTSCAGRSTQGSRTGSRIPFGSRTRWTEAILRKLLAIALVWPALACLLVPLVVRADAEVDAEVRQLQASIAALQQEQQSLYQQFQMTQELRRTETQDLNPGVIQNSPVYDIYSPATSYEDQER